MKNLDKWKIQSVVFTIWSATTTEMVIYDVQNWSIQGGTNQARMQFIYLNVVETSRTFK